jgi:creatinine amidohydrolase
MRYEMMLPHQIRAAIAANTPVVLPLGVLEYHGEHMAVGMDTLAVTCALDVLEKEAELVILPPFYYQTENFATGMPTDLAFKFGARQAIFAFLEKTRGEGWWGNAAMSDYYAQQAGGDDPFNWIKIHPLMTRETIGQYPFDHAGEGETSLMLAMCPDAVDMDRISDERWYTQSARNASEPTGARGRDLILAHMRRVLGLPPGAPA